KLTIAGGNSLVPPLKPSLRLNFVKQLSVQQGQSVSWDVGIQRNRFTGPVEVLVEGLPETVVCKPNPIRLAAGEQVARLEISAAADAPTVTLNVKVVVDSGSGVRTEEKAQVTVKGE